MLTPRENKFIEALDAFFNKPDLTITSEVFAPLFVAHVPLMPLLNRSGFENFVENFRAAFVDFRQEINDSVFSTDRIVLRVTYYGTHWGEFLGIPPTGCAIMMPGIHIFRIEKGLIVESWTEMDIFGVVRQISIPISLAAPNLNLSAN